MKISCWVEGRRLTAALLNRGPCCVEHASASPGDSVPAVGKAGQSIHTLTSQTRMFVS